MLTYRIHRNFTAFQNRFRMPGPETGGVGNFWYSFDYGLAHFISLDGETDFAYSPEWPFLRDLTSGETHPTESQTYEYAKTILDLITRGQPLPDSPKSSLQGKILIIGGGIANFTNVAATFKGIIRALKEYRAGLIAYTTYRVHPRYTLIDYSDIVLLHAATGRERRLTGLYE